MKPSRRQLLRTVPALLAAGALRRAGAAVAPADRRFLFVYCAGGWDPTFVFAPTFGNPDVDVEADATTATAGGLSFVDHPNRPSVRSFFEAWASRTAILNGFEVRSITHDRCRRILLTGRGEAGKDDWPSILAADAATLPMPSLVLSGPAYTADLSSVVVRTGSREQMADLLSGVALDNSTQVVPRASLAAEEAVDRYVRQRAAEAAALAGSGGETRYLAGYEAALGHLADLQAMRLDLTGKADTPLSCGGVFDQLNIAVAALAGGATRCAMVEYQGDCGASFDDHSDISRQSMHFEGLFQHLNVVTGQLAASPGTAGASLLDEVVLVVVSEMGRHPQRNALGGKDHWTFTSAMLVGAGIAGGRTVGAYDDTFLGQPVDLASGDITPSGASLTPDHLGATLLALGGIDPRAWGEADPIEGLLV